MKVKPNQLENGCILSKDIQCASNHVLMKKKTVLSDENIEIIKAFLVEAVDVEATLVNGKPFTPKEVIDIEEIIKDKPATLEKGFMELYLIAVQTYKKLFQKWQSGMKVDILEIRKILLPLLEKLDEHPEEIVSIHHYSTKQEYVFHHAVSVGVLSAYIGRKLNFKKGEEIQLGISGIMADSGMSKISNSILDKKGPLTNEEFEEIKKHPMFSYQMLKDLPGISDGVLLGVLQHHEREDASGYPLGVQSIKLHKFSKVIAVIDVYHAMTSERFYKTKQSPFKVIELIMKDNFGKFDIKVVQKLCSFIADFSIGEKIRLNSGDMGEIVFIEPHAPTRPMIKLDQSNEFIKLVNRTDLFIEDIII